MTKRSGAITLSISPENKARLEALALELGMTWGDRANISKLVEAIAQGDLLIAANHDWQPQRFDALNQARLALIDAGQIALAVDIAQLLLGRAELGIPLKMELQQFVAQSNQVWRLQIEHFIEEEKPFQLSFQDAEGVICQLTIRYAEIVCYADRLYLDCWAEEVGDGLAELEHNCSLRLDLIADAAIHQISGKWRSGLATIPVEFCLFGGLAFSYQSEVDAVHEWHEKLPQVRRVVRRVSSPSRLIREVLQYGQDCEVVSPESVRELVRQEILKMCDRY